MAQEDPPSLKLRCDKQFMAENDMSWRIQTAHSLRRAFLSALHNPQYFFNPEILNVEPLNLVTDTFILFEHLNPGLKVFYFVGSVAA
jgi:hypothetical protein